MSEAVEAVAVWRRGWFQWMLAVVLGLAIAAFVLPPMLALVYVTRSVLLPVVVALALAYIFNPVVVALQRWARMPRWFGTTVVMLALAGAVAIAAILIVPRLVDQAGELIVQIKDVYPQQLVEQLNSEAPPEQVAPDGEPAPLTWWQQLTDRLHIEAALAQASDWLAELDWQQVGGFAVSSLDVGVGVAGAAISFTSYLALAVIVVAFCFFFFSWKFDRLTAWFVPYIPAKHRDRTLDILSKMDRSVAAFIRGRLIQAAVMAVVLSLGWMIADVPGFLLLGIVSGLLNLIPFAAVVGFVAALGLNTIDDVSGGAFTWGTLIWPTVVYVIAQSLDGWVVEPVVQGKATDLDPVSVLLAVMIGGAVAGLLGMLLAIPAAACIKILSRELLLPKLRALAA